MSKKKRTRCVDAIEDGGYRELMADEAMALAEELSEVLIDHCVRYAIPAIVLLHPEEPVNRDALLLMRTRTTPYTEMLGMLEIGRSLLIKMFDYDNSTSIDSDEGYSEDDDDGGDGVRSRFS